MNKEEIIKEKVIGISFCRLCKKYSIRNKVKKKFGTTIELISECPICGDKDFEFYSE